MASKTIEDGGKEVRGEGKKRDVQGLVPWLVDRWPRITVRECRKRPAGIPCVCEPPRLRQTKANANYLHRFRTDGSDASFSLAFHVDYAWLRQSFGVRYRSRTIESFAESVTRKWPHAVLPAHPIHHGRLD